jgi:uncharacterized membrane protein YhfC
LQQVNAINAQPAWLPLLSAWERLWTVPFHVALSVVVLQVFRRNNIGWLWLAILAHAALDFTSVAILQRFGNSITVSIIVELIVAAFGLAGIWVIWKLRDKPEAAAQSAGVGVAHEQ